MTYKLQLDMNSVTDTYIEDRVTKWGDGKWNNEPDRGQWLDPVTGLPCLFLRVPDMGHLCGYVGVDHTHPLYGMLNSDEAFDPDYVLDCWGGVTWTSMEDKLEGDAPVRFRFAFNNETADRRPFYLIGFDCAHYMDLVPGMEMYSKRYNLPRLEFPGEPRNEYRDVNFVMHECTKLALTLSTYVPMITADKPAPPEVAEAATRLIGNFMIEKPEE